MALPPLMEHIATLEKAGPISTCKQSRVRTCELKPETYAAVEHWFHEQRRKWTSRYRKLDAFLEGLKDENP